MFEIFPIDKYFTFYLYPYEDFVSPNQMYILFTYYGIYTNNPYSYSSSVVLIPQRWNRVFVSIIILDTANSFQIQVMTDKLMKSTDSGGTVYSFRTNNSTSLYYPTRTKMKISFLNSKSIIRSVKYFKWALNVKSVQDMFMYAYSDNVMYNFQTDAQNNYFYYFDYWSYPISNVSNSCRNYATSDLNVCADLSGNKAACTSGYTLVTDFCVDLCGDGIVQLNPQMAQCDDGNKKDGDGCSSSCYVETGYVCEVKTNLNNKSYCYPMCGDGLVESTSTEQCDDGNYVTGDGCDKNCNVEYGFKCNNFADKPSFCYPRCGDGKRDTVVVKNSANKSQKSINQTKKYKSK